MTKEALPLLRYRTGDIAALRSDPCACGRTLVRMSKVMGRKDDMLVIRGVNVYPSEIERVLLADPSVAPDYLLVIDERDGGRDLIACCERVTGLSAGSPSAGPVGAAAGPGTGSGARSDDELRAALEHGLREALGLRVSVAIVPHGAVPRTEVGKAVRVRRWADGEPPVPGLAGEGTRAIGTFRPQRYSRSMTVGRAARIGVLGGTFDPIHNGHLVAASEVGHALDLDEVIFVPTGQPWQKEDRHLSAAEDRYLMTVIAAAFDPLFSVSRVDIDRPGRDLHRGHAG